MSQALRQDIVDSKGRTVALGREIGRGGEGSVFEIKSDDRCVAKIYHQPLNSDKADKIRLMASLRNDKISALSAWPLELLLRRSGEPIGLLMPKIVGRKDIHHLYSPKSRRADFQRADWRFLVRAAANTARAFAAVHEAGCVIGDVNHGGVLVAQDATVKLIDCDSFQVISNGRKFLCEVGVETFTSPELQDRPFKGIVRTSNHDNFGLAVMVFLLLFMGRHPFSGRYLGAGDMPIPKAIEQFRFAYGVRRTDLNMERPPGTPPLSIAGDDVSILFELAFSKQMVAGGRPDAKEWIAALESLEQRLKQCGKSPSHWHHKDLAVCPWCQMEAATGVPLFPVVVHGSAGTLFDLDLLWKQLEAIPHPGTAPEFGAITTDASREAKDTTSAFARNFRALSVSGALIGFAIFGNVGSSGILLWIAGILAFFVVRHLFDNSAAVGKFRSELAEAEKKWQLAREEWVRRAGSGEFDTRKAKMVALRAEWNDIPNLRQRKLMQLKQDQRNHQLERYLDSFEIDAAKIEGVGAGRKRTLESYGIETAADVKKHRIASVPGFGPKLQAALIAWRASIERRFLFDPNKGVDPRDTAKIELEVSTQRRNIEDKLRSTLLELRQVDDQIRVARKYLRPQMEVLQLAHAQAVANLKAALGG
ncbi:helix-hairpin-helix domain-containing protein [Kaistia granuli]|uniref:helix-hairpin-helix domain-containing protein n=1 Tax=Kaistia granuli TaxID=363259 RepID=UPI0003A9406D|nr:hypothetical protein [Kaistia granuli]